MTSRDDRARDIQESIRRVLLRDWDPIGVKDVPEAQDEYDGYVGSVYRLLAQGAGREAIAQYLAAVERDSMGISTKEEELLTVASRLTQLSVRLGPA